MNVKTFNTQFFNLSISYISMSLLPYDIIMNIFEYLPSTQLWLMQFVSKTIQKKMMEHPWEKLIIFDDRCWYGITQHLSDKYDNEHDCFCNKKLLEKIKPHINNISTPVD